MKRKRSLIFGFILQKLFQIISSTITNNYLFILIRTEETKKIGMAIENEIN
jgi:hypothetical protein